MNILERITNYHLTAVILGALLSSLLVHLKDITSGDWATFNGITFGAFLAGGVVKESVAKWVEAKLAEAKQTEVAQ